MNETVGGWEGGRGGGLKVDVGLLSLDTSCLQRRSTPPPPAHTHTHHSPMGYLPSSDTCISQNESAIQTHYGVSILCLLMTTKIKF